MPINLGTINQFFRTAMGPDQARDLIARQAADVTGDPRNLEEKCQRRTTLRQAPAWAVDNETASAGDSETAITRSACAARRRRLRSCAGHGPYRTCRIADDLLRLARRGIGTLQLRADGAASSKRASMRAAENERSKVKVEKSNPSAPSQAKSET